jgi:hypothetical protein
MYTVESVRKNSILKMITDRRSRSNHGRIENFGIGATLNLTELIGYVTNAGIILNIANYDSTTKHI